MLTGQDCEPLRQAGTTLTLGDWEMLREAAGVKEAEAAHLGREDVLLLTELPWGLTQSYLSVCAVRKRDPEALDL